MTRAPGTKKKTAASSQRLMDEVPLWPAAAIQRGPRTVAMLNRSTSQKPMVLRSWDLGSCDFGTGMVMLSWDSWRWSEEPFGNDTGLSGRSDLRGR